MFYGMRHYFVFDLTQTCFIECDIIDVNYLVTQNDPEYPKGMGLKAAQHSIVDDYCVMLGMCR